MGKTSRILDGLGEALAHARGEQTRARVTTWRSKRHLDVKASRSGLGLSRSAFARCFGFNLATRRQWEQGRRYPDGPARVLLRVIALNPRVVERAVLEPARRKAA
jgi:putative transcriptional regulator